MVCNSVASLGALSIALIGPFNIIGSIAAACEWEIDGNKPINVDLVLQKIDSIEKKTQYN